MSIRVIITFQTLPGKGADFASAFAPMIQEVRTEPGCEGFELLMSVNGPDRLVLLAKWSDRTMFDAHAAVWRERGPSPIAPLLDGAPLVERFGD